MKKLLKSLLFWRKDTSKEQREKEAEQKFEKFMTELVNSNKDTIVSQVKLQNTVTESLTQYSESVSEIMQSFQEQLEKMEEQFELFFHRENRQSKVLQKDINHIGSRIELVFNKTDVLIKSNRDMMKEISSLKPIPVDPFNQAEPIVRDYIKNIGYDVPVPLEFNDEAPLHLSKIQVVSNANSTKIYKKKGNLNYKEKQLISEIESYIKTRGAESFFFDTATNFEELESLHNLVKKLNPPLRLKDCLDCGDEFIYTHKNQLYCPKKHGITNYCKNEAKYKLSQERKS
jgi:hypothetical protein